MINKLISPYLASGDRFHTTDFLMYYVDGVDNLGRQTDPASLRLQSSLLARAHQTAAVRTTSGYSLRLIDAVAVVSFHAAPAEAYAAFNRPAVVATE